MPIADSNFTGVFAASTIWSFYGSLRKKWLYYEGSMVITGIIIITSGGRCKFRSTHYQWPERWRSPEREMWWWSYFLPINQIFQATRGKLMLSSRALSTSSAHTYRLTRVASKDDMSWQGSSSKPLLFSINSDERHSTHQTKNFEQNKEKYARIVYSSYVFIPHYNFEESTRSELQNIWELLLFRCCLQD